jgi:xylulokinase
MLPYLLGEKTPLNDPLARGAFVGLQLGHTRGHVFRAMLESFAYGVRHHLEVLAEHAVRPARARVTNGGASSALWKQIVADATGLVLEPVIDHPGSALGAAFAAGMGSGAFTNWGDVARFVALAEPIAPRATVAGVYDERYRAYRALYEAVRPAG